MSILLEGNVAYLPGAKASVLIDTKPAVKQSNPIVKQKGGAQKIALWGDNNLFPQDVIDDARKSTSVIPTLDLKARLLYGGGVKPYDVTWDDAKNEEILKPINDPEINTFIRKSGLNKYITEANTDLVWFLNAFPEFCLSKDRSKIVSICAQAAEDCRWELMDSNGRVNNLYINKNWAVGGKWDSPETVVVPSIDPYEYNRIEAVQAGKAVKYIYPVSYATPGATYYQLAHWNGLRVSGWLDVAAAIPKFKAALMKNQMSIKYHIRIPYSHWSTKYSEWETYDDQKKKTIMTDELDAMNKFLTDVDNTGKAFMSHYATENLLGKEIPGWEIIPIDNKKLDGAMIDDSREASAHTLFAMGVPSVLAGEAPGKNMGAGSGSNIREAYLMYTALQQPFRDISLEPINFITEYNGWYNKYPNLEWRYKDVVLTTLDTGAGTQKVIS